MEIPCCEPTAAASVLFVGGSCKTSSHSGTQHLILFSFSQLKHPCGGGRKIGTYRNPTEGLVDFLLCEAFLLQERVPVGHRRTLHLRMREEIDSVLYVILPNYLWGLEYQVVRGSASSGTICSITKVRIYIQFHSKNSAGLTKLIIQHQPQFDKAARELQKRVGLGSTTANRGDKPHELTQEPSSIRINLTNLGGERSQRATAASNRPVMLIQTLASRSPRNFNQRGARRVPRSSRNRAEIWTRWVRNLTLRRGAGRLRGHRGSSRPHQARNLADDEDDDDGRRRRQKWIIAGPDESMRVTYIHTCFIFR